MKYTTHNVSIHALLAECDHHPVGCLPPVQGFNPRTPCGVRPAQSSTGKKAARFQSTHSLRSATWKSGAHPDMIPFQSTHSLRSATNKPKAKTIINLFQSTHSLRSATVRTDDHEVGRVGFNPRTPCGVRLGDEIEEALWNWFQSTHSLRSATFALGAPPANGEVSIHALLAECDRSGSLSPYKAIRFNPRTPCGVRQSASNTRIVPTSFQSTHSLRSATVYWPPDAGADTVSIHALLAECDNIWTTQARRIFSFNPRTPCGVRQVLLHLSTTCRKFQSTHSLRSATGRLRRTTPF